MSMADNGAPARGCGPRIPPRWTWSLAAAVALGAALGSGQGVASAAPEADSATAGESRAAQHPRPSASTKRPGARTAPPKPAAGQKARREFAVPTHRAGADRAVTLGAADAVPVPDSSPESLPAPAVTVRVPAMPVERGASFAVSRGQIATAAADFVADGGDAADNPRFFFGDLAVRSLDALASTQPAPDQVRADLGNLAVSGYFGGVWLRDNLRVAPESATEIGPAAKESGVSAVGLRIFDALAASLAGLATSRPPIVRTAARVSVPVLLTLYGYNRGYLQFLLENPPAGVPSVRETLSCTGFLACNSNAFPLDIATRYDSALATLAAPTSPEWREMGMWTTLLEGATGTGRFVWGLIAKAGAFSPASYGALVDLSSAYLMVSKAAVLSSMLAYAEGDTGLGQSALRLQAGLWMWSGSYFAGLASDAPRGTGPTIVMS